MDCHLRSNPFSTPNNEAKELNEEEIPKAYRGAYFHKLASSTGTCWLGIDGEVQLGTPLLDPKRFDRNADWYLDGSNVYVGGNASGEEIDCGLHWEPVINSKGERVGHEGAYAPFWRNDSWHEPSPAERIYFHPGDVVNISVTVAGDGLLKLDLADAEKPEHKFTTTFAASKFGAGKSMSFKRVNDLAQHGNEGKPVIPTDSEVIDCKWLQSYFLWNQGGQVERFPVNNLHGTAINLPAAENVHISGEPELFAKGGESITITGNRR